MNKLYPLTASQLIHYRWMKLYHTQKVAGVSVLASLQIHMDFGLLKKCIQMEIERNEILRVRFTEPDETGDIKQYFVDHDPIDVPLKDMSNMPLAEAEAQMQEWAYIPLESNNVRMFDIVMVKLAEGYEGFFFHVDHRLLDSAGMTVMINDLMGIYCHYRFGSPMPEEPASFVKVLEQDLKRASNERRFTKDKEFWNSIFDRYGEPLYSDIQGIRVLKESRAKYNNSKLRAADIELHDLNVEIKDYFLDPASTKGLLAFCMNQKVSMTNLLLLGLRTYLSKANNGQEDITIENFVSRRSTHDQWTSGGSRTMMYPCRTVISPDTEFLDAAYMVQEMQNAVYMHSNYDPELITDEMRRRWPIPENTVYSNVFLTYQPLPVRVENEHISQIPQHAVWFHNGAATKKLYLTVSHTPDNGTKFSFHYQTAHCDEHDIELVYYYLMRVLFRGIEEPDKTIGEIIAEV